MIKEATTNYPVIDLIRKRWSARSFSPQPVSDEQLNTMFEAASWAASSGNEQPWQYYFAHHGTPGFDALWECLDGGNKPWTKNASVLMVSVRRNTSEKTGKENPLSLHDTGMANAHLFLQAISMDIYCHPMAGYDRDKVKTAIGLTEQQEPTCMIAVGYLDAAEKLEEPFKTRELTPRSRKDIADFIYKL